MRKLKYIIFISGYVLTLMGLFYMRTHDPKFNTEVEDLIIERIIPVSFLFLSTGCGVILGMLSTGKIWKKSLYFPGGVLCSFLTSFASVFSSLRFDFYLITALVFGVSYFSCLVGGFIGNKIRKIRNEYSVNKGVHTDDG